MGHEPLDAAARRIRRDILKMLYLCQSGHPGGSLSCVEILEGLYYLTTRVDADCQGWSSEEQTSELPSPNTK